MEIVRNTVPTMTLEQFAERHGLTMVITERRMDRWQRERGLPRFIAFFGTVSV